MKKNISIIMSYFFVVFFCENIFSSEKPNGITTEENLSDVHEEEKYLEDEKLFEEIIELFSLSYKNMVDIAALYFSGFSVNKDKLYDQIFIQLSKDMVHIIKLFAWYVPAMLKNPKLAKKEKIKKSFYIMSVTIAFSFLIKEFLSKNNENNLLDNNNLSLKRSLGLESFDDFRNEDKLFKPRTKPKIDC